MATKSTIRIVRNTQFILQNTGGIDIMVFILLKLAACYRCIFTYDYPVFICVVVLHLFRRNIIAIGSAWFASKIASEPAGVWTLTERGWLSIGWCFSLLSRAQCSLGCTVIYNSAYCSTFKHFRWFISGFVSRIIIVLSVSSMYIIIYICDKRDA